MNNNEVIGREDLKQHIESAYKTTKGGFKDILIVKGNAGIGKTYGITNILASYKGIKVITCKQSKVETDDFDLVKDLVNSLLTELLMLPDDVYKPLVYKIKNAIGSDLGYIVNFSDLFFKIFDSIKPKVIRDYAKEKYKVRKAIRSLIKYIVDEILPICIFFDDIQWSHLGSRDIIKSLIKDKSINCLFILSYRTGFGEFIKEEKTYKTLELKPLNENEINSFIIAHTCKEINNLKYLSRYIFSTTFGNPFYILKSIEELKDKSIIEGNKVYINRLSSSKISKDIDEIMLSKIVSLNHEEKMTLNYIVCLGGSVKKEIIQKLVKTEALDDVIKSLIDKNFIFEMPNKYAFTHDIILEYIYTKLGEMIKDINFDIAYSLYNDNFETSSIVHNIYNSNLDLWKREFAKDWFDAIYLLAQKSMSNQTFKIAESALLTLSSIMDKGLVDLDLEKKLDIQLSISKCKYMLGETLEAEKIYNALNEEHQDKKNALKIKDEILSFYRFIGKDKQVIEIGKQMLYMIGFEYNTLNSQSLLKELGMTFDLPNKFEMKTEDNITMLYVLFRIMPSAKIVSVDDFFYIMLSMATISLKERFSKYTLFGYVALSYVMFNLLDNYEKGKYFSDIVIKNIYKTNDDEFNSEVISFYLTFVHHWCNDLFTTTKLLEENNSECLENGLVSHFSYTLASMLFAYSSIGKNIDEAVAIIEERLSCLTEVMLLENSFINNYVKHMINCYTNTLKYDDFTTKKDIANDMNYKDLISIWFDILGVYLNGKLEDAYKKVVKVTKIFDVAKGHIVFVDVNFIAGLIRLEYNKRIKNDCELKANKDEILKICTFFEKTTTNYKENHFVRYLYLKAMFENEFGDKYLSSGLINKGIELSKEKRNLLFLAIGNLLAYKTSIEYSSLSEFYKKETAYYFNVFGATAISKKYMDKEEIDKIEDINPVDVSVFSKEKLCRYLLDELTNSYKCNYSAILLMDNEKPKVAFESNGFTREYSNYIDIRNKDNIKSELISYSYRTKDEIISKNDKIITKSIPLKIGSKVLGIIYLECEENNQKTITDFINQHMLNLIAKLNEETPKIMCDTYDILTPREMDILKLLASGKSNNEIAVKENISIGTVKSHLSNIYSKLEISSRTKATERAKELNII